MAFAATSRTTLFTLIFLLSACGIGPTGSSDGKPAATGQWFKGNTHAHTTLSGHGDTKPDNVAKYYLDHDYNFLILSEHNIFIDPDSVTLPTEHRSDFILIPGEEITGDNFVHTTAMNVRGLVRWEMDIAAPTISHTIQLHVDRTHAHGGEPILNHPNYEYAISSKDILGINRLQLFELFNGHPAAHNWGDEEHISTEQMWDSLLTSGMDVFAVSSDDAHDFKELSQDMSNPGRGWVMVWSDELSPDAIISAMARGDFYSTSGVTLKDIERNSSIYTVIVDEVATEKNLQSPNLRGKLVEVGTEGYRIDFIGPDGVILNTNLGVHATHPVTGAEGYVRARVTFTRVVPGAGFEEYYAWGQPIRAPK